MNLVEIDLKKGNKTEHPEINGRHWYLAKIHGAYFVGKFSKQWYGWNFEDRWGASGHQFDTPGTNASRWEKLWRMVP